MREPLRPFDSPGDRTDRHRRERDPLGIEPLLVDANGVAALLDVSLRHVRSMRARGTLPAPLSIGRRRVWRLAEIRAWVAQGLPPAHRWHWTEEKR